jgi:chromosome partitioning protein
MWVNIQRITGVPHCANVVWRDLGQEVTEALADYALPILSVRIMQRVLYPTTAVSGTTVLDVEPHGEAAKEIRTLMHEIQGILH